MCCRGFELRDRTRWGLTGGHRLRLRDEVLQFRGISEPIKNESFHRSLRKNLTFIIPVSLARSANLLDLLPSERLVPIVPFQFPRHASQPGMPTALYRQEVHEANPSGYSKARLALGLNQLLELSPALHWIRGDRKEQRCIFEIIVIVSNAGGEAG